jgi:hypothetical protein
MCGDERTDSCDLNSLKVDPSAWRKNVQTSQWVDRGYSSFVEVPIDHSLAKPTPPTCIVKLSSSSLLVFVICNAVKALCRHSSLFLSNFNPLAIVGDTIASFLDTPDPHTAARSPI